jgi:hypothetical protein
MIAGTTLMVNYLSEKELDGGSFGGAMAIGREGEILAEFPLGRTGMLFLEI